MHFVFKAIVLKIGQVVSYELANQNKDAVPVRTELDFFLKSNISEEKSLHSRWVAGRDLLLYLTEQNDRQKILLKWINIEISFYYNHDRFLFYIYLCIYIVPNTSFGLRFLRSIYASFFAFLKIKSFFHVVGKGTSQSAGDIWQLTSSMVLLVLPFSYCCCC